ncbi:MAG: TonB-dependent receptor plug domain-containing protein [Opitutus sp.]
MRTKNQHLFTALFAVASLIGSEARGQNAASNGSAPADEVIVLTPFSVSGERASRYQPTQSVSSGRIATSIADTAQSVSVIPRELIDDAGTGRIFDALKYAAGVSESTLPGAVDRITLRGFQTDNGLIDNFYFLAQAGADPAIVDRIEVVKGPNSILNPSGPAGGTINVVTKSPLFRRENSLKLQLGQYDANRLEGDFTGPLSDGSKFAYRMVFAREDSESYHDNTFTKSLVVMPMMTWRISPTVELTVKYLYLDWKRPPFLGYPVDPRSNSDNEAVMLAGVPRTRSLQEEEQARFEFRHQVFSNLLAKFSDDFSGRLSINGVYGRGGNQQLLNSGNNFGDRDPKTGRWVTGVSFLQVAPFTSTPLPAPSRTYNRGGRVERSWTHHFNLQNIYVLAKQTDLFASTSVFGFTADFQTYLAQNQDSPIAPINIDAPVYGSKPVVAPPNFKQESTETTANAFLSQQFRLFQERLFVSGSYTVLGTKTDVVNELASPETTITNRRGNTDLLSWSVLAKVFPGVGIYYADSNTNRL